MPVLYQMSSIWELNDMRLMWSQLQMVLHYALLLHVLQLSCGMHGMKCHLLSHGSIRLGDLAVDETKHAGPLQDAALCLVDTISQARTSFQVHLRAYLQ